MSNPGAASTSTAVYFGGGEPVIIGNDSASIIGFYGETGVAQQTAATAVATTAATSTTLAFGYTTSTQADAIVTAVNAIIAQLSALGLTT